MPIEEYPGLPGGYQVRKNFEGRFYVLLENKNPRPLIIEEFCFRPALKECLDKIRWWEEARERLKGWKRPDPPVQE